MDTFISSNPAWLQAAFGGVLIGLASWLLLASIGRVAGVSGIAAGALVADSGDDRSERAWRVAFIVGLVVAGAAASMLLPSPPMAARSFFVLMAAGLLVGFGTILGSGCTSGHGVCGMGRGSLRSLIATLVFMAFGALTVFLLAAFGYRAIGV
jgi:uncharacterized protein